MRVLVITQYFFPESFRINDLVESLNSQEDIEIHVLTGKPNYPKGEFGDGYSFFGQRKELWNGIPVFRVPLFARGNASGIRLMLNYLSFALFASWRLLFLKGSYDVIFVYEPSPVTVGIPAAIAKRKFKAPLHFWVQDLWPQSIVDAGGFKNQWIINKIDSLTKWIYSKCDTILIQSQAFEGYILKQLTPKSKAEVIYYPNTVEDFFKPSPSSDKARKLIRGEFNLMFAGNIGESQDFETLISAAEIAHNENPNLNWHILGNGRKKEEMEAKIEALNLGGVFHFHGAFPVLDMPGFFASADVLLVSLKASPIFDLTIPSKLQSYLACGKPILASLSGEGGRIVRDANCGKAVDSGNPEALAQAALELSRLNQAELEQLGTNGLDYFKQNFDKQQLLSKLVSIFKNYGSHSK